MKYEPIRTEYGGARFRSRLEARWAVFFDEMGIEWEYEPVHCVTSEGHYLPDFLIRVPSDFPYWFEVKPPNYRIVDKRHSALCVETARPFLLARGLPRSYGDQFLNYNDPLTCTLRGDEFNGITAMLWGDSLLGARETADGHMPDCFSAAFVGRDRVWKGKNTWDIIHKARYWYCDPMDETHVALNAWKRQHHIPDRSDMVTAALVAAWEKRFH